MAGPRWRAATIAQTLGRASERLQVLLIEGEPGIGKSTVWLAGIEREAHSRAGISFERISVAIPIDDIEAA